MLGYPDQMQLLSTEVQQGRASFNASSKQLRQISGDQISISSYNSSFGSIYEDDNIMPRQASDCDSNNVQTDIT